jgi:hypothetical protein
VATTYTVTTTFTAGTTAVASEVNQNFTDLLTALNAFDASNQSSGTVPLARISGLTTTQFATNVVDTDGTLAANSDTRMGSQKAIKTYVDASVGSPNWTPSTYAAEESVTFPNGLIMKFGYATVSATTGTITFGAAFPTAVVSCSLTMNYSTSTSQTPVVTDFTTADIDWHVGDSAMTGLYWQAWGY